MKVNLNLIFILHKRKVKKFSFKLKKRKKNDKKWLRFKKKKIVSKEFSEKSVKIVKKFKNLKINYKFKFFKNDVFLFLKRLFNSFIRKGKKYSIINYFFKLFFFVCLKFFKKNRKNKTKFIFLYFYKILYNILPAFVYTNLNFKGENVILPWFRKNKKIDRMKILKISVSWIKKSIDKRKEKTLFFKIISELEDLRKNKGDSIINKNEYYKNFYNRKYYIRFLKNRIWV